MQISDEQLAALDALAKDALAAIADRPDAATEGEEYNARLTAVGHYLAHVGPESILPLIAELREYRHLCAQVREVYESDSGFGEGMVISCHRESQCKGTQAVAAMLIWQQPADESADLRIGIRADMT